MLKADGSVLVHADAGGYKPLNWMTPPTAVIEEGDTITVRKIKGEDALEITLHEVVSDVTHPMDFDADRLSKDGVEADLQVALADAPHFCGEGFRLVRREWPTDIGPVDLMCRDARGRLGRGRDQARRDDRRRRAALPLPRADPAGPGEGDCRGVLAAQTVKPQARVLAESRGLAWVEVDLAELRGEREPALTLFALTLLAVERQRPASADRRGRGARRGRSPARCRWRGRRRSPGASATARAATP